MTTALKYDASVLIDSGRLAWKPYAPAGYPAGLRARTLRRLDDGSLRSAVLDVPAGWASGGPRTARAAEQAYIISGALHIGGIAFKAGSFYFVPAGAAFGPMHSAAGAQIIVILDGEQSYGEAGAAPPEAVQRVVAADVPAIEQVVGVKRRLAVRKRSGTRMVPFQPGLRGARRRAPADDERVHVARMARWRVGAEPAVRLEAA